MILIVLTMVAIMAMLMVTRWGAGLSPDSLVYVGAARSFAAGDGLMVPFGGIGGQVSPMTHHAPMYSVLLSTSQMVGVDVLIGGRFFGAVLFGLNALLVGLLVYKYTAGLWAALLAFLFTVTSLAMLMVHAYAWSESVFIFFTLIALLLLAQYLESSPKRIILLVGAAVLVALATLTRYAGAPLMGVGILAILLFDKRAYLRRLADAVLFGVIALSPLFLWFYRNTQVGASATSREIVFHPIGWDHFLQAMDTLSAWFFVPVGTSGWLKLIVILSVFAAIGVVAILWHVKGKEDDDTRSPSNTPIFIYLLILYVFTYSAFLVLSISFFDANTPLDDRILSPVYISGVILTAFYLHKLLSSNCLIPFLGKRGHKVIHGVVLLLLIVMGLMYVRQTAVWGWQSYQNGLGFASAAWQQSEIAAQLNALPEDTPIYSNAPGVVYLLSNQSVGRVPKSFKVTTQQTNTAYQEELNKMQNDLQEGGKIIFFTILGQTAETDASALAQELLLDIQLQTEEAVILVAREME